MPSLYFKMNFNLELFATDKKAQKALSDGNEKSIGMIILHYKSGNDITKRFGEGAYDIIFSLSDFHKKSEINLSTDNKVSINVKGVAKKSPNADLYQYLIEDATPTFFLRKLHVDQVGVLYASKKESDMIIDCVCSKTKS